MDSLLKNKPTRLFVFLSGFFIANALVAEFVGGKIFSMENTIGMKPMNFSLFGVDGLGFNLSAGVLMWPFVFIMTDIINEYFGIKVVRFLSILTAILIGYAFFLVFGAIKVHPNDWWAYESGINATNPNASLPNMNLAFSKVMGQGMWIIVGSLVAFLVGQLVDVMVFHKIKKITGEKNIWLRSTGSTLVSQFIDSFVVLFIAFYIGADWHPVRVLAIGLVNYTYKFSMAILLTPVIYIVHNFIDNYLGKHDSERMKNEALAD